MAIRDYLGETFPLFPYDARTRDALAAYCARRWPSARRQSVAREWSLSADEARSVVEGKASWATWDKIIFHKRGRWIVLLPIFGALLNETVEHHIIKTRKEHAEHAQRLGALVGDPWLVPGRRPADPNPVDRTPDKRREPDHRRAG